jgi:hypothetical protein
MSVKFRTINTGKFHLAAHCYTANASHAGSINHNGVKIYNCFDPQVLRNL